MIELLIGIFAGGSISWIITHLYYRKSNIDVPEWAKPLIKKLPEIAPSKEELLKLFQKELNNGNINLHPVFWHVACPICKLPITELKEELFGDDNHTILVLTCPNCGWSDSTEI